MTGWNRTLATVVASAVLVVTAPGAASSQEVCRPILPEQLRMQVRHPSQLATARLPDVPPPQTVSRPGADIPIEDLSLDGAIRTSLANMEVIRVLGGVSAASSGRTIYDPAITNTGIDEARGRFDPQIGVQNDFSRQNTPQAEFDAAPPFARIVGDPVEGYDMTTGLSKTTITGGEAGFNVRTDPTRVYTADLMPLNPNTGTSLDLSYSQPLLQGGGVGVNLAPIVIARIDTERSFFQMKDSVQQSVRGVVEGYWALVFARTDLWARQQQLEQGQHAFNLADARFRQGLGNAGDVAQARSALAGFRASLVSAEAGVLQREAALRNILGLPPSGVPGMVPVTPPSTEPLAIDWTSVLRLAEEYRPDLIELKLILEADQQRLLLARNQALPRVDASALYRWNGLEGRTPDRALISAGPGDFTGWQLGVSFSVPLGLRQSRAQLRQQELLIMRDRANLQQGLHSVTHSLAANFRNLDQYYRQYVEFHKARQAARANLDVQFARYDTGLTAFINVLEAITTWGNSVSSESQALLQYNTELANLEQQTGTILEAHGVRFFEERYGSIGPLGRLFRDRCYPRDFRPGPNEDQYQNTVEPAEEVFDLRGPIPQGSRRREPTRPAPLDPQRLQLTVPEQVPAPAVQP
ncbi:MAG: TolC family protein [Pirellulales bacterium]|nr:TolC family protein [Pirellulales bacterium]